MIQYSRYGKELAFGFDIRGGVRACLHRARNLLHLLRKDHASRRVFGGWRSVYRHRRAHFHNYAQK